MTDWTLIDNLITSQFDDAERFANPITNTELSAFAKGMVAKGKTMEGAIEGIVTDLSTKVDESDYTPKVATIESNITTLTNTVTALNANNGQISAAIQTQLNAKADNAVVDTHFLQVENALATKANVSDIANLTQVVSSKVEISVHESKVTQVENRLTVVEIQNATQDIAILEKASKLSVDSELALKVDKTVYLPKIATIESNIASLNTTLNELTSGENATGDVQTQLSAKVDKSVYDAKIANVESRLTNTENQNAAQDTTLASKAAQSDLNNLTQVVNNATANIETKVALSVYNPKITDIENRLTSTESVNNSQNTTLATKASQSDVAILTQSVATIQTVLPTKTDKTVYDDKIAQIETKQNSLEDAILQKASLAALSEKADKSVINPKIAARESDIATLFASGGSGEGASEGAVTYLQNQINALDARLDNTETQNGLQDSEIAAKATQLSVSQGFTSVNNAIASKVSQSIYDAKITDLDTQIATKASQTQVDIIQSIAQDTAVQLNSKVDKGVYNPKIAQIESLLASKANQSSLNATNLDIGDLWKDQARQDLKIDSFIGTKTDFDALKSVVSVVGNGSITLNSPVTSPSVDRLHIDTNQFMQTNLPFDMLVSIDKGVKHVPIAAIKAIMEAHVKELFQPMFAAILTGFEEVLVKVGVDANMRQDYLTDFATQYSTLYPQPTE